jgi:glucose-6-phosphate dehydrogenase assembly protein OpcA
MGDVQIVDIYNELKKLHAKQVAKKEVVASLFTLITYVHDEERAKYLRENVQNIIEKYPCRTIFIKADNHAKSGFLKVDVSTVQNNKGGTLVACDQINIEVAGDDYLKRVPFLILPHLLTDLPVYLLWGQDVTCSHEILIKLEKLANRLIFDAECTKNLKCFSNVILEKKKNLEIDFVDISWALCSGWRDVITQTFYLPEHLQQLQKAKKITFVFNNKESEWVHQPEMQSIYLQAWIASCLKWQLKGMAVKEGERTFLYTHSFGECEIKIAPSVADKVSAGGVVSFEMLSYENHHMLLERDAEQSKVYVKYMSPQVCELPYSIPLMSIKRGVSFMNEIFYSLPSSHYIDVLEMLTKL